MRIGVPQILRDVIKELMEHPFTAYDRPHSNTSQSSTRAVSNYIFKRYYTRIHYSGERKLNVKDNKGIIFTLTGSPGNWDDWPHLN